MADSFASTNPVCGEKVVGNGTVQLVTATTRCMRVWIGAPTGDHPKAGLNTGSILVGFNGLQTLTAGARPLTNDNATGFYVHVDDASKIYLRGANAGDAVEYCIE